MRCSLALLFLALAPLPYLVAEPAPVAPKPRLAAKRIAAVAESSLATGRGQIRQYAFDDNPNTYFESEKNATQADHFSLVLDTPVAVTEIQVLTGRPDGTNHLDAGVLEVSADGKKFDAIGTFKAGSIAARLKARSIEVIRIRPTADLTHPLAIREIIVDSKPGVAAFRFPVEFVVDVSDAPDMKSWAEKAARICEQQYSAICDELMSPGFRPLTIIHLTLKSEYNGVAAASGDHITGSVKYFKAHLDDFGAMVHETTHCIQRYRSRRNPGWLVEGVADYIRFFRYEPGKIGRLNVERAKYDGSYRVTAAFLNYVAESYDPLLVSKLNRVMREGTYDEGVWKQITGKTVEELNQDWRRSFAR